jgi:hypothetical protein
MRLGLLTDLFPFGFPTNAFSPCWLHALSISSFVTWSLKLYLAKFTIYEAPYYATSCEELAGMIKQDVLLLISMLIGNYWEKAGLIISANIVFLTTLKKLGRKESDGK